MRHMGLDLSLTAAGVIVYDGDVGSTVDDHILHREVCGYGLKKSASESMHVGRMLSIATAVCRVAREFDVDMVTMEGPAYNQVGQLFHLGGLHFVVSTQLRLARKLHAVTVPSTTARKEVFGRGSKPRGFGGDTKAWVAAQLRDQYDIDLEDDNLNDALVQCLYRGLAELETG